MARVRSRDTKPERAVRRLISNLGCRYRLHARDLPGRPDIVLRRSHKAIFVHGCFWHRHRSCALARIPKSRTAFWINKLEGNRLRDLRNERRIRKLGWQTLKIWECELRNLAKVEAKVRRFLDV